MNPEEFFAGWWTRYVAGSTSFGVKQRLGTLRLTITQLIDSSPSTPTEINWRPRNHLYAANWWEDLHQMVHEPAPGIGFSGDPVLLLVREPARALTPPAALGTVLGAHRSSRRRSRRIRESCGL